MKTIKINVYRSGGEWFGARWIGGEYDGCDALDASTEEEALEEARTMPLATQGEREINRVADA
ncbi:MAG TPA: hypothetical protein VFN70_18060 [Burkholderiales bacterium]|nr:hypothetical protein [Burkholderiales bacterium]